MQSGVCFKSQYVFTLLTNGYGFNEDNWDRLHFQKSVMVSLWQVKCTAHLHLNHKCTT